MIDAWEALGEPERREPSRADRRGSRRRPRRRSGAGAAIPTDFELGCRRSPTPRRSSASGSTTAPTPPRPGIDPPDRADDLRQVPQRAGRAGSDRAAARARARRSTTRPRSPSSIGRRAPRGREASRRSITSPATPCSTTSRPATCSSRPRNGWRARSSTAPRPAGRRSSPRRRPAPTTRSRSALDAERRDDAGGDDRRPDLLGPRAARPPLAR